MAAILLLGTGGFLYSRKPSPGAGDGTVPGLPAASGRVAAPAISPESAGIHDPAYGSWPAEARSAHVATANALRGEARGSFLKELYRIEADPAMRLEILSYFEEGEPSPEDWKLLKLLLQTESDPDVREGILMTAAYHEEAGVSLLRQGLRDPDDNVRVLAEELIEELGERKQ